MFKIIKKLVKLVTVIIGAYAAINTLFLAKIGMSRIARQLRIRYQEGTMPDTLWDTIYEINSTVIDESEEEWDEWKNCVIRNK